MEGELPILIWVAVVKFFLKPAGVKVTRTKRKASSSDSSPFSEGSLSLSSDLNNLAKTSCWLRTLTHYASSTAESKLMGTAERWVEWGASIPSQTALVVPMLSVPLSFARRVTSGKHSFVWEGWSGGRRVAVKTPRSLVSGGNEKEAAVLRLVNEVGVGPELLDVVEGALAMEWCEGIPLVDFIEASRVDGCEGGGASCRRVVKELLRQCSELDRLGVVKSEGTHPERHVLVQMVGFRVVLLDFDRALCRDSQVHKNVTQTVQFLSCPRLLALLNIRGQQTVLRSLGREYSKAPSPATLQPILNVFGNAG